MPKIRWDQYPAWVSDVVKEASESYRPEYSIINDELRRREDEVNAAKKLCEIYFNIAAECVGEDEVRRRRDCDDRDLPQVPR